jgi:hypothetical protein
LIFEGNGIDWFTFDVNRRELMKEIGGKILLNPMEFD